MRYDADLSLIGGCLLRASRHGIDKKRSLEKSGIIHMDPVGGRATEFNVGMLTSDKLNACPRLAYGNND